MDQITTHSQEAWRSAAEVMDTLRKGFLGIQDQIRNPNVEIRNKLEAQNPKHPDLPALF